MRLRFWHSHSDDDHRKPTHKATRARSETTHETNDGTGTKYDSRTEPVDNGQKLPLDMDSDNPASLEEDDEEPSSDDADTRRKKSIADHANEKAENHGYYADDFGKKLRRNKAKAQREVFLYFLIRGATHSEAASTTDPTTVYFSLLFQLATPFGLLGNMGSIISLCDHWRMDSTGHTITDKWWVLLLNAFALACGCFANLILFLHAERWMRRTWGLITVCVLYLAATCIYMAILGATQVVYFRHHRHVYYRTSGYWHAVCASALYFFSALALASNLLYFRKKKWNAAMSRRQRRIMVLCSMYIAWIAIGGATFQPHTMIDVAYADSAYYCVVSCLTLGYGDISPSKTLPRALAIPYIYIGLVLGGLATLAIFEASLSSARSESISTHVEQRRHAALQGHFKSEQQSFDSMRHIMRSSREQALLFRAIITTSWLVVFWLIGALIFKYTEGWKYFDAFYYVAVSLATVGYGDLTPSSSGGRSFFLYWALLAVPTMTTAVSDMSAVAMQWLQSLREFEEKWRVFGIYTAYRWYKQKRSLRASNELNEASMDATNERLKELTGDLPNRERWHALTRLTALPTDATFPLDTWHTVVCEILGVKDLPADFWLSDMSPIRMMDFNERQFLLLTALNMLRLSMPETDTELKLRNATPEELDTSSTVRGHDGPERTQPA